MQVEKPKKLAAMVPVNPTSVVRLRSKTSTDSLPEEFVTPQPNKVRSPTNPTHLDSKPIFAFDCDLSIDP